MWMDSPAKPDATTSATVPADGQAEEAGVLSAASGWLNIDAGEPQTLKSKAGIQVRYPFIGLGADRQSQTFAQPYVSHDSLQQLFPTSVNPSIGPPTQNTQLIPSNTQNPAPASSLPDSQIIKILEKTT